MARFSKNSRRGDKTQRHYCPCGGEIKMHSIMEKAKIRHYAKCEGCETEKRKPSLFK
jgi:formate dehydrogenase maturation protein FdhE